MLIVNFFYFEWRFGFIIKNIVCFLENEGEIRGCI